MTRSKRLIILLLGLLFALGGVAQEAADDAALVVPDPASLQSDWWSYFEGPKPDVEPRVEAFLKDIGADIAQVAPQNQALAKAALDALRDNLTVYLTLLDGVEPKAQELPEPAAGYSIEDLLVLAATARDARAGAAAAELEVERERRILAGASRRRDTAFKEYVSAAGEDQRLLVALRLMQARSAQAISERRLELLTQSFERATGYAKATAQRVELARERLTPPADQAALDELMARIEDRQAAVQAAQKKLREAEVAASGLMLDTAQGLSQQRLDQQRVLGAQVALGLSEVALAQTEAQRWWTELQLETAVDLATLEDRVVAWSELARSVRQQMPESKRQAGDELIAVQGVARDGLDRSSRRLLDQRLGTVQETLAQLAALDAAVADLELLTAVVTGAVAEYSGALRSWLTSASRFVKSSYIRVKGLAGVTLFSVGETPVTGGDLLKVLIILLIAMLASRGVQHTIQRFGESDSAGAQASLYTVGRLSHYAIIIIAILIALSAIGLDFSNLALVAGALSVGIGFGLQSIVNNFVSGLIILFERTLRVGDYIELDTGLTGTVKAINVRSTLINTNDNIDIVVPNSEFVTTRLTNWTLGEYILRVRIPFGVAYGSDKEIVKKAALEAAAEVPYTLKHTRGREPDVWLVEYGDSSLNFLLLTWVNRQGARRPTRTRAAYLWALETKLNEYGIEIPFPQRDLHLRSGWPQEQGPAVSS